MTPEELNKRGLQVKPLVWEKVAYTTTDDDNGPREGMPRKLHAWRSGVYLVIQQDGDRGLFLLRGKRDGIGLAVHARALACSAAEVDHAARICAAISVIGEP